MKADLLLLYRVPDFCARKVDQKSLLEPKVAFGAKSQFKVEKADFMHRYFRLKMT